MTLLELVQRADAGYRKGFTRDNGACLSNLLDYVEPETGRPNSPLVTGDTLALFVVRELSSAFDPNVEDEEQLSEARASIESAIEDLGNVLAALDD